MEYLEVTLFEKQTTFNSNKENLKNIPLSSRTMCLKFFQTGNKTKNKSFQFQWT